VRALIAVWLALAVVAAGCFDTAATTGHRHHYGPSRKHGSGKQASGTQPSSTPSSSGTPSKVSHARQSEQRKAQRWHLIVTLRRRIASLRYAALQVGYLHHRHLTDKYPEFRIKSTRRLTRMLHRWQARLASWEAT